MKAEALILAEVTTWITKVLYQYFWSRKNRT